MKLTFRIGLLLLFPIMCGCASSSHNIRDVSKLMPPAEVGVDRDGDTIVVSWQPSPHDNRDNFAGYHVYVARRSLTLAPVELLPTPIEASKNQHSVTVDTLDATTRYFVHVRSRLMNGNLSLPSLPEIIVEPESPKNP